MIRMLSLFSGIGAFEKALTNLNIPFELVNYCEIDRYASKSYAAIHNVSEALNLTDVTKVNTQSISDIDLITYGFPCQDISAAGYQKGFVDHDGNCTRSGLFFEALRIIQDLLPKYAIAENVKALVSKKFSKEFRLILDSLDMAGYNNYYDVLNAKDYGIPQNRERVFIVSIRKDIDTGTFNFPPKEPLTLRLRDMLEDTVDGKYYLSKDKIKNLQPYNVQTDKNGNQLCRTIKSQYYKNSNANFLSTGTRGATGAKIEIVGNTKSGGERAAILNPNGICNCLSATDYKQPKQIIERIIENDRD